MQLVDRPDLKLHLLLMSPGALTVEQLERCLVGVILASDSDITTLQIKKAFEKALKEVCEETDRHFDRQVSASDVKSRDIIDRLATDGAVVEVVYNGGFIEQYTRIGPSILLEFYPEQDPVTMDYDQATFEWETDMYRDFTFQAISDMWG